MSKVKEEEKAIDQVEVKNLSEMTMEQFDAMIAGQIKSAFEGLSEAERKAGLFPGVNPEKQAVQDRLANAKDFMKALYGKDQAQVKALSEGTDSEGGYLVPKEFTAEILRLAEDYGVYRSEARILPMGKKMRDVPVLTTGVTATIVGEAVKITESDAVFDNASLTAKKLGAITALSNELLADSSVGLVQFLAEIFAEAIAGLEDEQGFVGDGTGTNFTGCLIASGVNEVDMASTKTDFEDVTYDNLVDMITGVKSGALPGAKWFMHRTVWAHVLKLKDDNGNPIVVQNVQAGASPTLLGYPVRLTEKCPANSDSAVSTAFVVFGNLKRACLLGDRQEITMSISQDATVGSNNLFEKNMSGIRVIERAGIVTAVGGYLVRLVTAAS